MCAVRWSCVVAIIVAKLCSGGVGTTSFPILFLLQKQLSVQVGYWKRARFISLSFSGSFCGKNCVALDQRSRKVVLHGFWRHAQLVV